MDVSVSAILFEICSYEMCLVNEHIRAVLLVYLSRNGTNQVIDSNSFDRGRSHKINNSYNKKNKIPSIIMPFETGNVCNNICYRLMCHFRPELKFC